MPVMHTAIPYTGSTADQAVSTVHVGTVITKHTAATTRILLYRSIGIKAHFIL